MLKTILFICISLLLLAYGILKERRKKRYTKFMEHLKKARELMEEYAREMPEGNVRPILECLEAALDNADEKHMQEAALLLLLNLAKIDMTIMKSKMAMEIERRCKGS